MFNIMNAGMLEALGRALVVRYGNGEQARAVNAASEGIKAKLHERGKDDPQVPDPHRGKRLDTRA
ncbi:MAG: hypothetical protein GC129_00875 [Proteobacteria bacterium]|nr:hypothetical protein [Pseudomonadota bacterium]